MKIKSKKFLFIALGAVIVIAVVVANLAGNGDSGTEVQADLASVDDISEIVSASGRIQPQTKVDIVAEVSAQVINLGVNEGDTVSIGQPLVTLDTVQLESDVSQARYSLDQISARTESARARLEKDEREYNRQKQLFEQQLTSETLINDATYGYESAKADYDAMQAEVKTAQARLDKAADNLRKTKIVAPMNGVITYLSCEVGEIAQAQTSYTQGKTLMTISDLSVFEVEVDVDETEISKVHLGQNADIRVDAFRDSTFPGTVTEIGNSATISGQGTENYTTSFRVKVRFDREGIILRPGMSATVDITTATADDALLVPYASLVVRKIDPDSLESEPSSKDSGGLVQEVQAAESDGEPEVEPKKEKKEKVKATGVFVIRDGKVTFSEVETGIADERNIAILSGLQPGDTVVSGSFQTLRKLSNGDQVNIEQRSIDRMTNGDEE